MATIGGHPTARRPPRRSRPTWSSSGPRPAGRRAGRPLRADGPARLGPGGRRRPLEGSKAFMKEVLAEAGVPTARFGAFDAGRRGPGLPAHLPGPWVVKTDGLAAGKGVLVTDDHRPRPRPTSRPSSPGRPSATPAARVVIEEGWWGEECSLLVLCDGTTAVPLLPAQDFKRLGDGDRGPNTGGMGAYSPMPHWSTTPLVDRHHGPGGGAAPGGRPAAPGHRLPRRALRRPHAHRRRAQGARVQRALRRSRDPGGAAPGWTATPPSSSWRWPPGRSGPIPAPTFSPAAAVCVVMASRATPSSRGPVTPSTA
jgi:hypothetical protein